jgi:uncharacterized protein YjbI with pentapeptide repeats
MTDAIRLLRRLGRGAKPSSLGLATTPDGYVDARNLRLPVSQPKARFSTPAGNLESAGDFAVFRRLRLRRIDLSGSRIADSLWLRCRLEDVNLDNADARMVLFSRGTLERVSFRRTDLSGSVWGTTGSSGPLVSDCAFIESQMVQSAYGHPLFRRCHFNLLLDRAMFDGAEFEDCTFEGTLRNVWFDRTHHDPNPVVARRINTMKNVDFSRARMVSVSFMGIDLSSVTLPTKDCVVIHRPRTVFERAFHRVKSEWVGQARKEAATFLEIQLASQIRIPDTAFIFNPNLYLEAALDPNTADRLLDEIRKASEEF